MTDIVLATLNARWTHASLGLRCLHANLGALREHARIVEATLATPLDDVVARILGPGGTMQRPRIVGLGVYIWNVERTTELVHRLRAAAPATAIVLGGPEVSHETEGQAIVRDADHVVTGPGEQAFARLAQALLHGPRPLQKVVPGGEAVPEGLVLPYELYTEADLAHRHLYVEASRGCPFRCAFCLSALDRTAWPIDPAALMPALERLHARGARRFRFVDRTFNLKPETGAAILRFFLERIERTPDDPVFAHFELVPDRLPDALKDAIRRFPPGALQFEIGIQTWDEAVQRRIDRRQDNARAEANLRWLREHSSAHLHVDLIAGLPGEDLAGFGAGFDRLVALRPHEIQVGVLKRLRGAPIARQAVPFGMRFDARAPYAVIETAALSASDVARIVRFARYWDLFGNSGRFPRSLPALLGDAPFARFIAFADALWSRLGATHRLSLETQAEAMVDGLRRLGEHDDTTLVGLVVDDYAASGASGRPAFLARGRTGGAGGPDLRALRHVGAGPTPAASEPDRIRRPGTG